MQPKVFAIHALCVIWVVSAASQENAVTSVPARIYVAGYQARYRITGSGTYTQQVNESSVANAYRDELDLSERVEGQDETAILTATQKYRMRILPPEGKGGSGAGGESGAEGSLIQLLIPPDGEVEVVSGPYLKSLHTILIPTAFVLFRLALPAPQEWLEGDAAWRTHARRAVRYAMGGKTTLALEATHKVARRFQDGGRNLVELKSTVSIYQPKPFRHERTDKLTVDGREESSSIATSVDKYRLDGEIVWVVDAEARLLKATGTVKGAVSAETKRTNADGTVDATEATCTAHYVFGAKALPLDD